MSSALTSAVDSTSSTPAKRVVLQTYAPTHGSPNWSDAGMAITETTKDEPTTEFVVLMKLRNQQELEKMFQEVSDPNSSQYGHFRTPAELADLTHPPKADQDRVMQWLTTSLPSAKLVNTGESVKVSNAKISEVEKTFACQMHKFVEKQNALHKEQSLPITSQIHIPQRTVYRCVSEISVPVDVATLLTGALGLLELPEEIRHGGVHPARMPWIRPHHVVGGGQKEEEEKKQQSHDPTMRSFATADDVPSRAHPVPVAHPHHTLRTTEQIHHAAALFEQDQMKQQ